MMKKEFLKEAGKLTGIESTNRFGMMLDQFLDMMENGKAGILPLDYAEAVKKLLKQINNAGTGLCIGDAFHCEDTTYGFIYTNKYYGHHESIFCHRSDVPIRQLHGFKVLASWKRTPKGLRSMAARPLWSLTDIEDDHLFNIFSNTLDEVNKETLEEFERQCKELSKMQENIPANGFFSSKTVTLPDDSEMIEDKDEKEDLKLKNFGADVLEIVKKYYGKGATEKVLEEMDTVIPFLKRFLDYATAYDKDRKTWVKQPK